MEMDIDAGDEEVSAVVDEKAHSQLIKSILSIAGKRVTSERGADPNYGVKSNHSGAVKLSELVTGLKTTGSHVKLKKQLGQLASRSVVVNTPLPAHQQLKVDRSVAYDETTKELSKWSSLIHSNRKAEQLKFPLEQTNIKIHDLAKTEHTARTPLEIEIEKLIGSKGKEMDEKFKKLTAEEKLAKVAMSLAEARERHASLRKHRILVSYKTAKETRVKRIKSKSYRRQMRRERAKQEKAELEKLKKDDPEEFLEKMEEAENARVKERLVLKHRRSSKYAKRTLAYAKFDEEAKKSIQEMLEKQRELKNQKKLGSESEESGNEESASKDNDAVEQPSHTANPWMKPTSVKNVIRIKTPEQVALEQRNIREIERTGTVLIEDRNMNMNKKTKSDEIIQPWVKEDIHSALSSNTVKNHPTSKQQKKKNHLVVQADKLITQQDQEMSTNPGKETDDQTDFVDPNKVLKINHTLQSFELPASMQVDSDDEGVNVMEAFADDNVVDEFIAEKNQHIEEKKIKDIDTFLPGWGSWAGSGVEISKKKKERFIVKAPPAAPRKDSKLGNVIINEKKDDAVARYQIKKLPFPFKSNEQFEKAISTPVGKTWIPETAFKELTRPKIITRLGTIIEPMNKEETFKKQKAVKVGKKRGGSQSEVYIAESKFQKRS